MAKNKPLPTNLQKRKEVLDKQIAHIDTFYVPTNLDGAVAGGGVLDGQILHKLTQVEKSHKRVVWGLSAVALAAISLVVYMKREDLKEVVTNKPANIEVTSRIPLIDSSGNDITNAVTYELSTKTHTRQLVNGGGKALLVQVNLDTSNNYRQSTLGKVPQVCMPQSEEAIQKGCAPQDQQTVCVSQPADGVTVTCLPPGELSADSLFAKFVSLKNTENDWICLSEVASLVNEIKTNADAFENDNFSVEEIISASTVHETAYQPYTNIPMPESHNEIIFVDGDVQLVC